MKKLFYFVLWCFNKVITAIADLHISYREHLKYEPVAMVLVGILISIVPPLIAMIPMCVYADNNAIETSIVWLGYAYAPFGLYLCYMWISTLYQVYEAEQNKLIDILKK